MDKEIKKIIQRNKRVESDKAWETSKMRVFIITLLTYIIAVIFMYQIEVKDYYFNALVPTGGYFLSTLSVPFIKKWWVKHIYKR